MSNVDADRVIMPSPAEVTLRVIMVDKSAQLRVVTGKRQAS